MPTPALLAIYGIIIFTAWALASAKGRGFEGLMLGLFLGPLGMILAGFLKPSIAVQAKLDVQLEAAKQAERERIRAELIAETQQDQKPYRAEIGRPPGAD